MTNKQIIYKILVIHKQVKNVLKTYRLVKKKVHHQTACNECYLEIFICQSNGKKRRPLSQPFKSKLYRHRVALHGHKLLFKDRIFKFQAQKMNNTIAEHNDDLMKKMWGHAMDTRVE